MEAPVTTAAAAAAAAVAPEYLQTSGASAPETMRSSDVNENNNMTVAPEKFSVEEFLDFSNDNDDDLLFSDNTYLNEFQNLKADCASVTPLSSVGGLVNSNSTDELGILYDDPAELELVWRIEEEKFPTEDMEKLRFISGKSTRPDNAATATHEQRSDPNSTKSHPEIPVLAKTRTKRARPTSVNWSSPLLLVSESDDPNPIKKPKPARKYGPECLPVDGRKCQHCQTDKTPQWRTGPMGPKTLCNACGVRFKTGRLVPEYRPASSPTFVQTKHSNSHRKVMELRRQKESMMMMGILPQQNQRFLDQYRDILFDGSNGDEFFIHPLIEPDFGQLI